jgi:hypothetical protein
MKVVIDELVPRLVWFLLLIIIPSLTSCTWFVGKSNAPKQTNNLRNNEAFVGKSLVGDTQKYKTTKLTTNAMSKLKVKEFNEDAHPALVLDSRYCRYDEKHWSSRIQSINHESDLIYQISGKVSENDATIDSFSVNEDYISQIMLKYPEVEQVQSKPQSYYDAPSSLFPEFVLLKRLFSNLDQQRTLSRKEVQHSQFGKYDAHSESMSKVVDDKGSRVIEQSARFLFHDWYCTKRDRVYIEQDNYMSPAELVRREKQRSRSTSQTTMNGDYRLVQKYSSNTQKYYLKLEYTQFASESLEGVLLEKRIKCVSDAPMFVSEYQDAQKYFCQDRDIYITDTK